MDSVRANRFASQIANVDVSQVKIPVIGGHSGPTIVPLFSAYSKSTGFSFTKDQIETLTKRVQYGGDEVVQAKDGGGSATLSMAFAAREFVRPFLEALNCGKEVNLTCFVFDKEKFRQTNGYLAVPVHFSKDGKAQIQDVPEMDSFEGDLFKKAVPELQQNIQKGIEFVQNQLKKK